MVLIRTRIPLIATSLILLLAFSLLFVTERASADDVTGTPFDSNTGDNSNVTWNWTNDVGNTVRIDFQIATAQEGNVFEIEVFIDPSTGTPNNLTLRNPGAPVHSQKMGNFGSFPTNEGLSFIFSSTVELTAASKLGLHLHGKNDATIVSSDTQLKGAVNTSGIEPIASPLTPTTPAVAVAIATPTPEPVVELPPTGDVSPSSGLLLGLLLAGFLLIVAGGGTYLAQSRRNRVQ
jgi:hypothetical protein